MSKMNLPNKLTLLRFCLVPVCIFTILFNTDVFPVGMTPLVSAIVSAVLFLLTSLTDMFDGMIARKYHLITDFGKLMDPLADKMLVLGVMLALIVRYRESGVLCMILSLATFINLTRELAVTSLRLVVAGKTGVAVAANWMGKAKTVTQMIGIILLMLEPFVLSALFPIISYVFLGAMTILTVASGINYFRAYWPHIDPEK